MSVRLAIDDQSLSTRQTFVSSCDLTIDSCLYSQAPGEKVTILGFGKHCGSEFAFSKFVTELKGSCSLVEILSQIYVKQFATKV